ncbi:heme o synthase [Paenibacillus thermotolerans]|uniref:heme o synthase n=1 Tax=Paenibacillus thermotolerans TaxID=3027807 RepID=UPI0023679301|nr:MULTISPECIES: heme o synthase [unclassified Paenibacillus]
MNNSLTYQTPAEQTAEAAAVTLRATWKDFFMLTKPRMLASNLIPAVGGFWVASRWEIDWAAFIFMLIGTALVMGSGCAFNNVLDREHDMKMERTKQRAIPLKKVKLKDAIIYATVLGLAGIAVLYFLVNPLTALLGIIGHVAYVIIYTAWLKRSSTWSTSIGGISGAVPPVIGYCAVTESVDIGAWLLFGLLFFWQPPHFWALGIRRVEEYRTAGYPLLPVVKGVKRTKWQMIPYLIALYPTTVLLYTLDYVGPIFLVGGIVLLTLWTVQCIKGLFTHDRDQVWAMRSFKYSLYYLTFVFLLLVVDTSGLWA